MTATRKLTGMVAIAALVGIVAAACGSKSDGGTPSGASTGVPLTGAGATFPQPIYALWFKDFQKVESGAKINYQAIGSGGGVQQFTAQTVDFGASDAPLKTEETAALPATGLEIPTVIGGVVIAYTLSGVDAGLKLDAATAADIFLGKVTKWNDPEIAQQNAGVTLPATAITVAHRADESGTTKVFTSWLAAGSPEWSTKVGADKAVNWPVGSAGNGNDGVAALISQTDGTIGYLSYDFAVAANLGVASIKSNAGEYVAPSVDSISKAGGGVSLPITPDTNILNSTVAGAYPISTTTYLLVYQDQKDKAKGQTLVDLVYWCLTKGQAEVKTLNYARLPSSVAQAALAELAKVTSGGTALTPSSAVKS
jgi:phosphate transport system substrate-binding protein